MQCEKEGIYLNIFFSFKNLFYFFYCFHSGQGLKADI